MIWTEGEIIDLAEQRPNAAGLLADYWRRFDAGRLVEIGLPTHCDRCGRTLWPGEIAAYYPANGGALACCECCGGLEAVA